MMALPTMVLLSNKQPLSRVCDRTGLADERPTQVGTSSDSLSGKDRLPLLEIVQIFQD
jgi:hypothetical protein